MSKAVLFGVSVTEKAVEKGERSEKRKKVKYALNLVKLRASILPQIRKKGAESGRPEDSFRKREKPEDRKPPGEKSTEYERE